jgi:hypothetical protein
MYSKQLEVSIMTHMRGPALQNSVKTAILAHLWPFIVDENCDALPARPGWCLINADALD